MGIPHNQGASMKTFSAKVDPDTAARFESWCDAQGVTPYSAIVAHIQRLADMQSVPHQAVINVDFSRLGDLIFPYLESAMLAIDLMSCRTVDELPSWFTNAVAQLAAKHNADPKVVLVKLQQKATICRQLLIEEAEQSAREREMKLDSHYTTPSQLSPQQLAKPRITMTDEEAEEVLNQIING